MLIMILFLYTHAVLEEAMQFHTCVTRNTTPLKPQSPTISGWAQVVSVGACVVTVVMIMAAAAAGAG